MTGIMRRVRISMHINGQAAIGRPVRTLLRHGTPRSMHGHGYASMICRAKQSHALNYVNELCACQQIKIRNSTRIYVQYTSYVDYCVLANHTAPTNRLGDHKVSIASCTPAQGRTSIDPITNRCTHAIPMPDRTVHGIWYEQYFSGLLPVTVCTGMAYTERACVPSLQAAAARSSVICASSQFLVGPIYMESLQLATARLAQDM